jgi:hypothetical protein
MNRLLQNLAVAVLSASSILLTQFTKSAQAVPIDAGPVPTQSCFGSSASNVDCVRPTQTGQSYINLYWVKWKSGGGMDVYFCNATKGYTTPTLSYNQYNGCSRSTIGPGWPSNNARNPYWSGAANGNFQTDIYVNVHNTGTTTGFDVWANPTP